MTPSTRSDLGPIWAKVLLLIGSLLPAGSSGLHAAQCQPLETATFASPSPTSFEAFAYSSAISGDTLVVGDPSDSELDLGTGAVLVFRRSDEGPQEWKWVAKLHASDATAGQFFGRYVAVDGNILAVGSPLDSSLGLPYAGAVYVFERSDPASDEWTQAAKLTASDPQRDAVFGLALSVAGNTLLVGAPWAKPRDLSTGSVYVFERKSSKDGHPWRETQRLFPANGKYGLRFGSTLASSHETLAVGAPLDDTGILQGGAVYVYRRDTGLWVLEEVLSAPDASINDGFYPVAMNGNQILIGAASDDDLGANSGSVYVFTQDVAGWHFSQKLLSPEGQAGEFFGTVLSAEDDLLVVAAPYSDSQAHDAGVVYSFRQGATGLWSAAGALIPSKLHAGDLMQQVDLSEGVVALGMITFPGSGRMHIFDTRLDRTASSYCSPSPAAWPECQPTIGAFGNATASGTSAFTLRAEQVPAGLFGFFAYTHAPTSLPIEDILGTCLPGGALGRSALLFSNGTFGSCDGSFELDWNDVLAAQSGADPALAQPGTYVYGQFAFFGFNGGGPMGFTDAVAFVTCP
jgi:hypothetical protein